MPILGRSPAHVLVWDECLFRIMVVEMLENAGFTTSDAPRADAAWAVLEQLQETIRVLLTGIDMTGSTDGFVLAGRVASAWPHIGLIMTLGERKIPDGEVTDPGRFLRKPYCSLEHLQVIRESIWRTDAP